MSQFSLEPFVNFVLNSSLAKTSSFWWKNGHYYAGHRRANLKATRYIITHIHTHIERERPFLSLVTCIRIPNGVVKFQAAEKMQLNGMKTTCTPAPPPLRHKHAQRERMGGAWEVGREKERRHKGALNSFMGLTPEPQQSIYSL